MSKFFVTGGSGFIGSSLVKKLLAKGHYVKVYDDFSRGKKRKINIKESRFSFISGDVRDEKKITRESKGFDYFIHLAAINGTKFFYEKPDDVLDVSIRGILAVIGACKKNLIKKLIFASSSEVYQTPPEIPTDENVPLIIPDVFNPRYSYGAGKIISEMIVLNYLKDFFKKVIIFRPHNVYGPDMGWEHVIPEMILRTEKLKENDKTFRIKGDGKQTRSFIFIKDFTDILYKVIMKGKNRNIYHIGNNDEIKIITLARKILKQQKKNVRITHLKQPAGETKRRCPSIKKIESLGYKQSYSIDEGLKITTEWYLKNKKYLEKK